MKKNDIETVNKKLQNLSTSQQSPETEKNRFFGSVSVLTDTKPKTKPKTRKNRFLKPKPKPKKTKINRNRNRKKAFY